MDSPPRETLPEALSALTARQVPGLAAVLIRPGEAPAASAAGVAEIGSGAAFSPDTVQPWFSMTKIVTATAALQLAEQGALDLDDPVRRFLPDFPERRAGPPVLVRHLLSHSSGLPNPIPVRWVRVAGEPGPDARAFTEELLGKHGRLRFDAGSKAVYSNLGYIALGEVIAAAAGTGFERRVREAILEPLGMSATGFAYEGLGDDVAVGYQPRFSPLTPLLRLLLPRGIVAGRSGRYLAFNRFYVDGPAYGGLIGSARDAARFMAAHLGGGELEGERVLSPEGVRRMQAIAARGRKLEVGLGWNRPVGAPGGQLEHLGGGGGFWTLMRILPERGVGVLAMGNSTRYDHERLARAALADQS